MLTLADRFEYDAWANLAWVETLAAQEDVPVWKIALEVITEITTADDPRKPSGSPVDQLKHLLWVQGVWLVRVGGTETLPISTSSIEAFRQEIGRLRSEWQNVLANHDLDEVFTVKDGRSQADLKLGDIATHVLEKSAFYRGQIDMLATYHRRDVPETGFLHYLRDREAGKLPA